MKNIRSAPHGRRAAGVLLAAVLAVPTLAACGSDDDSGDDGGSADGGDPIKVMVYGPIDAPGFSIPGIETGARAGVEKVNSSGGINGRELKLVVCNDGNDPNTAAGCARQAQSEGVLAVIGGLTTSESEMLPGFQQAGIPVIGQTAITTFAQASTYPIAGGAPGALFSLGKSLAQAPECNGTVGMVLEEFDATVGAAQLFGLGVQAGGAEYTGYSGAPQGATDFAPAVAAASGKADCLGYLAGPQTSPVILKAITAQGGIAKFGASETITPSEVVAALGKDADGSLAYSAYLPLNDSTDTPEMKEFLERGRAIDPDFSPEQTAASAYLSALVLQQALADVDVENLTSEDIIEALNGFSGFETGLGPVVDFTDKNPTKAFSRMPYSSPNYEWIAKDGEYVLNSETPVTIDDVYDIAAQAGQ